MNIIITGPSGSGKSTIIKEIKLKLKLTLSVSFTTRSKREHEVDGVDYNFISVEEFKNKIANNELEEYTIFNGNYYGTPILLNKTQIFDLEYEGVEYFINNKKDCIFIFIDVDKDVMKGRLVKRGANENDIERRISKYEKFQQLKQNVDFDLIIDNNGDFNESVKTLLFFLREKLN